MEQCAAWKKYWYQVESSAWKGEIKIHPHLALIFVRKSKCDASHANPPKDTLLSNQMKIPAPTDKPCFKAEVIWDPSPHFFFSLMAIQFRCVEEKRTADRALFIKSFHWYSFHVNWIWWERSKTCQNCVGRWLLQYWRIRYLLCIKEDTTVFQTMALWRIMYNTVLQFASRPSTSINFDHVSTFNMGNRSGTSEPEKTNWTTSRWQVLIRQHLKSEGEWIQ